VSEFCDSMMIVTMKGPSPTSAEPDFASLEYGDALYFCCIFGGSFRALSRGNQGDREFPICDHSAAARTATLTATGPVKASATIGYGPRVLRILILLVARNGSNWTTSRGLQSNSDSMILIMCERCMISIWRAGTNPPFHGLTNIGKQ
jgi:hypothetical protein